jgi:hypothetical protein
MKDTEMARRNREASSQAGDCELQELAIWINGYAPYRKTITENKQSLSIDCLKIQAS